jgi:AcrR family transcriptional regulator
MERMSEAGGRSAAPARSQPRRGRTPSADVERELLAAAEAVLVREGPGGLTVRAVAAEAGVAPMNVYNRLGGKDGLVAALLIRGFDRLTATIAKAREEPGEPGVRSRLLSCGMSYRAFALANPHLYAIMFEDAVPVKLADPAVEEHAAAAFGVLVSVVELGAAAGVLAAPEPFEAAQQIWSAVHGAVALELKGMVLTPDPEFTYQTLLATIVRGLSPR